MTTLGENITVTIKQLDGTIFTVQLPPTGTVGDLKRTIEQERNISPERQRLIFKAQELRTDGSALSEYGVVDQSTLHIVIRPLGSVSANNNDENQNRDAVINMPQNNAGRVFNQNPYAYNQVGNDEAVYDVDVLQMVRRCRFVRIFTIIDFIFLLLFGLTLSFLFLIMAVLALAGYYGAKTLNRSYLAAYMLCLVLEIAMRCLFIYLERSNAVSVVLFVLMIFIDLFVLRCVLQLYKVIPRLDVQQRSHVVILNRTGFL
ncbi:hypothetical protein RFI_32758 [Reticulomyxa filosa]|uniref:Ubiquitin-like domain-containing protein n=1 Tax=Reticulomyxa filosa TaxID=46433 RepID=X6LRW4_RETFI|nr:hypothetical protein RFI_32758 [Reticulomyxa filosa]|eukprot:ETO04638.1 hypothetical protein RFI_32758 [Reticulomyxa filosa]